MNKTILLTILVLISFACFAGAEVYGKPVTPVVKQDACKCQSRAVVHCGFSKSDEARKCRTEYLKKCNTRCNLILKCSAQISEKCLSYKKGSVEYKRCERSVSAQNCVSLLKKEELYNCKCKSFAKAVCGNCPSPSGVHCRDDAYEACKKQCSTQLPCKGKKRICITDSKCNCKTQATHKCAVSKDSATCYKNEYDACNKRCIASTRCYPVSCKNAGVKRCAKAVAVVCNKYSADLKQFEQCVAKKTQRCHAYELATCKKARRLFKYRAECDYSAKIKCEALEGEKKCSCFKEVRSKCIEEKKILRKKWIRHSSTCKKRAKLLCDAKKSCKDLKACYLEETKHCIRRRHRREYIVPPECVYRVIDFCGSKEGECYKKNLEKCTEIWLRRHCERKSFKICDGELECMKLEIRKCKSSLPKCWHNRQLCNDHNKCTNDVCNPDVGCLHIPKTCNDNNLCTTDVCSPDQGCVHTENKCDDGVSCTIDTCNTENGQCEHEYEHSKCHSEDKCHTGICTASGCKFYKDAKCELHHPHDLCTKCHSDNPCVKVRCEIQEDFSAKCITTEKNCDDKKKCTLDSCNASTGRCHHTKLDTPECTVRNTVLCEDVLDCAAWASEQQLVENCLVPVCDTILGVCVARPTTSKTCVTPPDCHKACPPRDACDVATPSCSKDEKGKIICNRGTTSCDDTFGCTVDSCNANTGVCEHKFVASKDCIEKCETDEYCIQWAIESGLDTDCKTAKCNKVLGSCEIVPQQDQSKCSTTTTGCIDCVAKNSCERVKCFYDEEGKPACKRVHKKCDDGIACTVDSCNTETGKCTHTPIENKVCKKCRGAKDCEEWGKSLNLAPICKAAVCNKETHFCEVRDLPGSCLTCVDCVAQNKCQKAECVHNKQGEPICKHSFKDCNDNDDCTTDSCNIQTGECEHTPVENKACHKCQVDTDCKSWADNYGLAAQCKEAYCSKKGKCKARLTQDQSKCTKPVCIDCLPLNPCDSVSCIVGEDKIPRCEHSQITCDDGDKCTTDYCDVSTGKCVHAANNCQICTTAQDCVAWAQTQNLKASCQESYCENNYCRVRFTNDQSNCHAPLCSDCHASLCDSSADCVFGPDNTPTCVRNPKSCDDGNKCTVDSCDQQTGNCVNVFFQTDQCQPCSQLKDCTKWGISQNLDSKCKVPVCNQQGFCESQAAADQSKCVVPKCRTTADCAAWSASSNLADKCLQAVCDTDAGKCTTSPVSDTSKCPICQSCKPFNLCDTATCTSTSSGFICQHKPTDCNDNNDCTKDFCSKKTGKCVHKTIYNSKCISCNKDIDCTQWGVDQKLSNCEEPFCNIDLHACDKRAVKDVTCVPDTFCQLKCPPKDKCFRSHCHYDSNKNVICDTQTPLNCNDNNDCTTDSCDGKKGCVNVYQPSAKCVKCTKDTDCSPYAISNNLDANCKVAFCNENGQCDSKPNPSPCCIPQDICTKTCATDDKCLSYGCTCDDQKKVKCTYVAKTCNDGKSCTKDSCDKSTGLCIHEHSTDCGPQCTTTANCIKWGIDSNLAANCQQPFCDLDQGACVAVSFTDVTKCPVPNCDQICKPADKCHTVSCSYDATKKVVCTPAPIDCNDNDDCTVDSCNPDSGCTHKFIESSTCVPCSAEKDAKCAAWAAKLGDCFTVSCDLTKKKCVKQAVDGANCHHTSVCPPVCAATAPCQVATLVKTLDSCTCQITPLTCDDGIACTTDYCDKTSGKCVFKFTPSQVCTSPCTVDGQCAKFAADNNLAANCQYAACDAKLGACVIKTDGKCTTCQKDCKPHSPCEDAQCIWNGAKYTCQRKTKFCDDGKKSTTDVCNPKTGVCEHVPTCTGNCCNTDVDCVAWGKANNLDSKCLVPKCSADSGSCVSVPDSNCKTICKQSSDCPPSQYGSVCDTNTNTCVPNKCKFDADCLGTNNNPNVWNYCLPSTSTGQLTCVPKPKCTTNSDCEDSNPCTQDICLTDYGLCRNMPKCDDNNACTLNIATPSADGKSCSCSNPPVSCTQDASLLNANFVLLSNEDKQKWLGKCDKLKGCLTCVVNAQCDDHNGCSVDSCQKQFCVNDYVTYQLGPDGLPQFNPWCDPKLASQPIYYQGIPGLRDNLALAGYDINKLGAF